VGGQRVKINLGAGIDRSPGWIAYDRSRIPLLARSRLLRMVAGLAKRLGLDEADSVYRWPAETRSRDVTKGIPHESDSVDAVYSSHMLEHLERGEARSCCASATVFYDPVER
jgi:predicted SAM-dependent methyltransferase